MAYDLIDKTFQKYNKIFMYFMSDGVLVFPESVINKFDNNLLFKSKIYFYSIAFGSGTDVVY